MPQIRSYRVTVEYYPSRASSLISLSAYDAADALVQASVKFQCCPSGNRIVDIQPDPLGLVQGILPDPPT